MNVDSRRVLAEHLSRYYLLSFVVSTGYFLVLNDISYWHFVFVVLLEDWFLVWFWWQGPFRHDLKAAFQRGGRPAKAGYYTVLLLNIPSFSVRTDCGPLNRRSRWAFRLFAPIMVWWSQRPWSPYSSSTKILGCCWHSWSFPASRGSWLNWAESWQVKARNRTWRHSR